MLSMKRASHKKHNKIPLAFRIKSHLVEELKNHSAKTNINKTRIVELALSEFLTVKREA